MKQRACPYGVAVPSEACLKRMGPTDAGRPQFGAPRRPSAWTSSARGWENAVAKADSRPRRRRATRAFPCLRVGHLDRTAHTARQGGRELETPDPHLLRQPGLVLERQARRVRVRMGFHLGRAQPSAILAIVRGQTRGEPFHGPRRLHPAESIGRRGANLVGFVPQEGEQEVDPLRDVHVGDRTRHCRFHRIRAAKLPEREVRSLLEDALVRAQLLEHAQAREIAVGRQRLHRFQAGGQPAVVGEGHLRHLHAGPVAEVEERDRDVRGEPIGRLSDGQRRLEHGDGLLPSPIGEHPHDLVEDVGAALLEPRQSALLLRELLFRPSVSRVVTRFDQEGRREELVVVVGPEAALRVLLVGGDDLRVLEGDEEGAFGGAFHHLGPRHAFRHLPQRLDGAPVAGKGEPVDRGQTVGRGLEALRALDQGLDQRVLLPFGQAGLTGEQAHQAEGRALHLPRLLFDRGERLERGRGIGGHQADHPQLDDHSLAPQRRRESGRHLAELVAIGLRHAAGHRRAGRRAEGALGDVPQADRRPRAGRGGGGTRDGRPQTGATRQPGG